MSSRIYENLENELNKRKEKNLFRSLKTSSGIDFCSNDYLGLSRDVRIAEALTEGIHLYGNGSTASRLVRGHLPVYENFENSFNRLVESNASLFVANGFTANLGLLDAIANLKTVIFTDRLNHASILDGIRLSGAKKVYYNHLDLDHLRSQLEKHKSSDQKIIVSETIFSMDGDHPNLEKLVELKKEFDAILILDETHAFGVYGQSGAGLAMDPRFLSPSLVKEIDFRIFTMGKSLGLEGGIIACSNPNAKDYLINCMRGFVFSTAPMPCLLHAGIKALEIVSTMDLERSLIEEYSVCLRKNLSDKNYDIGASSSQIIPVILNSENETLEISYKAQNLGYDLRAIRPPTVPTPRLRISIHSDRTWDELKGLADLL
ncbi:aminotransferase class I/II-fold pyridoxal phosphate-dependent enzyme [Leptospira sp. GIMC2001]|uniref:aminotransferase class I/II-fold pyridoxal phosphate-dependent enzyme n=1 Tax=Leptospira sp. GIMC2001 TaxID=1513297 RepID=UPI00234B75CB|nr:8-amino-7-oxononanoate synthase [Leptospira sp. GIMC2001]WCL48869.1 8-amino-7-oxononanoate synthase [Leptospira sp. GIMC2001]